MTVSFHRFTTQNQRLAAPSGGPFAFRVTSCIYSHAVSQDRMAAAGEMLLAILSHAGDQSEPRADCREKNCD